MKDLPLLQSERKQYESKIRELKAEKEQIYAAALRKFNSLIIRCDYLETTTKEKLLADLWKGEK